MDIAGIGFGPSNLALAIYAREVAAPVRCLFFERQAELRWHPGMQLHGARMQISFLKDLVTLRNPASPYSFLQYLVARGRLEHFVNLGQFRPTRLEYEDYLRWAAADFADQVRYHTAVRRVLPDEGPDGRGSLLRLELEDTRTGQRSYIRARNVVYAAGGRPHVPAQVALAPPRVVHASQFEPQFPAAFADTERPYVFTVAGGGQSAGEVVEYLLGRYPQATVHLVITRYALRPTDNSPFVNEQYYTEQVDDFYASDSPRRAALARELANSNYGVVREDLIDRLYDATYHDAVAGRQRLVIHRCSRLAAVAPAEPDGRRQAVTIADRFGGPGETLRSDGVVLATGCDRSMPPEMFGELLPLIVRDQSQAPEISRGYRVQLTAGRAGLYVQGFGEARFGLGDTLLSLLPFRAKEIVDDICQAAAAPAYPPRSYVESDTEKLHALIERYRFATLIAAAGPDRPLATHLPLILDPARGPMGTLFGHVDRANPQASLLDGHRMMAVFHGPNAYMAPSVFDNAPLPTWNSMAVHVWGRVRLVEDRARLVQGLCEIARRSGPEGLLTPDDPRIPGLIDYIAGFELEIDEMVGRFKLSQEHDEANRHRAAVAMVSRNEEGERDFIRYVMDLQLQPEASR